LSSFLRKIRQTVARHGLLRGGERLLLGVSGGPDSMALLHALADLSREWRLSLAVAYLDHGVRPEAAGEWSFVEQAARALDLPFLGERADVRALAGEKRLPLQEAAREARYAFLSKAARGLAADKIALGHTADDQAESVLMRLLRGSGTLGLSGIPAKRGDFYIRPLIDVHREEVEVFLREKGIAFREDASNRSPRFLRNRIRRELIPILEVYNPKIRRILAETAERFRLEEDFWRDLTNERFPSLVKNRKGGSLALEIPLLAALPPPLRLRVFRAAVETVLGDLRGFGYPHFRAVENLWAKAAPNKQIRLPRGLDVSKSYAELVFSRGKAELSAFEYVVSAPGTLEITEIGREMRFALRENSGRESPGKEPGKALLEGDHICFPLTVRSFRPGDRFQPLGMEGQKKIKDFFIDRKIPPDRRRRIPLLLFQDRVLWVAGLRLDHRFRLKPESRRVLEVEFR
jgi:tRNA(Ile)-lysidine synthase